MLSLRTLTADDFPLLLEWLARPHVKAWWDDGDDTLEKIASHYDRHSANRERFILLLMDSPEAGEARPIGYLQYEIDSAGVAGIDQFIGEETLLGRGIGTQAIHLLIAHIVEKHAVRTITVDPAPTNMRAIRCYEKVGFRHDATLQPTGNAEAYMMKLEL